MIIEEGESVGGSPAAVCGRRRRTPADGVDEVGKPCYEMIGQVYYAQYPSG